MRLTSLDIAGFRNLERVELDVPGDILLIHGANGQGKTNLLEAIYYLVTGRSFRTHLDGPVLPFDSAPDALACIEGQVRRANGGGNLLRVVIGRRGKRILIDEKPAAQLGALWGRLRAVLFTPDDLNILKGGPALRRRMIDVALSQIDAEYLKALQSYARALRSRNLLLREAARRHEGRAEVEAYNHPLAEWGAEVLHARALYLHELNQLAQAQYARIAPEGERLEIKYWGIERELHPPLDRGRLRAALLELLEQNYAQDLRRGQTLRGVHRDELRIALNNRELRLFGSQGQQRAAMLSLRLAELELMEKWTGEPPILLLDDLASELDASRREHLFRQIENRVQTLITVTDPQLLGPAAGNVRKIQIRSGALIGE